MRTFFDETDKKPEKKLTKPPAYSTRSSQSSVEDVEKLEKPPLTSTSTMYASAPVTSASPSVVPARAIPDMYAPQVFDGVHPDPETWLAHFKRYVICRQLTEDDHLAFFPLFLKGAAIDWYDTQSTQRTSMEEVLAKFTQFFCPTPLDDVTDCETVFTRVQKRTANVRNYFSAMQKLAKRIPGVDDDLLKGIIIRGLQP